MSDWIAFEGCVVTMEWGKSTYTVIPLPADVTAALDGAKRVEGEINDHPVNLAPTRAPVMDGQFLWAGKSLLDDIGVAPGDPLEIRLRPAPTDQVEIPDDVQAALRTAGCTDLWGGLTPGKRRGLLHSVNSAKRADTRTRRIAALIAELKA
ncbi:YdeI/OmpD-associated family protein [Thalassococcus sp. S3]|uniref:YdeI/OmpD-associated family protein n=1 Tax=Thalassococcus sp. S3 TaxID=2017482 RepID=UPI001024027F|nr:YdeI/OmpD-associated family protein [Thalassococcus sp. S3]QBF30002.1 hypothetical protein CFI11_02030 [Thalassococcus sp. S3]